MTGLKSGNLPKGTKSLRKNCISILSCNAMTGQSFLKRLPIYSDINFYPNLTYILMGLSMMSYLTSGLKF